MKPYLPPRDPQPAGFPMSPDDRRIAAREDEATMEAMISDAIARCLAEGVS